jgi:hypothetical protein
VLALSAVDCGVEPYGAISLKQQSVDRHVSPLGHIILIPNQPVFVLSLYCCVLSREATNTNFIVFDLSTIEDFVLTKYVANSNNGNNIPIKPNAAPLNFALKLLLATTLKQNKYYKQ